MNQTEQRRSERVLLSIPIRVIGFDPILGEFSEETHTTVVNRAGARIALKHQIAAEDAIRIINLENYNEADFRIVGPTRGTAAEASEWGVECTEEGRNIWGIELPPPLSTLDADGGVLLECRACRKQVLWPVTLMEVEVLDATGLIQRNCEQCAKATYWTYADVTRRPREFGPDEPVAPKVRVVEVKKPVEKRTSKRLGMKLPILVRNREGKEEIVKTENISKGGFAVSLAMDLNLGDVVTLFCPYTPGGQNIEGKAEVRQRAHYDFGGMRLYGFRYVH